MPFPKVVGEGGWFTGVTLPSKQAINHDGIDSRLAVAGSPSLHHHAGIIKRIRDVQDVETPGKIHQFSQLTLSLPFRSRPLIVSNGASP